MYVVAHLNMNLTTDLQRHKAIKTNVLVIQYLMQDIFSFFFFKILSFASGISPSVHLSSLRR